MVNSLAIIEDLYKTMHSVLISKSSARRFKQYSETIQSEAATRWCFKVLKMTIVSQLHYTRTSTKDANINIYEQ